MLQNKKSILLLVAFLILNLNLWGQFAGGDGSTGNPYQITNATQLNEVRNYLSSSFIVMNDIDLTDYLSETGAGYNAGAFWMPIGNPGFPFLGDVNGNGKKITGLKINRPNTDYVGLFGFIGGDQDEAEANLINIGVEIASGSSVIGKNNVGGLVGFGSWFYGISNSYVIGNVNGTDYIGGLMGSSSYTYINNSYTNGAVSGHNYVGGLTGATSYIYVNNSYANGSVNGDTFVGGLVGSTFNISYFTNNYATSTVTGITNVGGFAGFISTDGSTNYSYAVGAVTGVSHVGGLVGAKTDESVVIGYSYWDIETTGIAISAGGVAKTTAEMKQQSTFVNWDFATPMWNINPTLNNGYPYFEWQGLIPINIFTGGDGTPGNPYQISTPEQLNSVRYYLSSSFIVMNDIDLTGYLSPSGAGYNAGAFWIPIGSEKIPFKGNFNGNGKKITGLKIHRQTENNVGLFGWIGGNTKFSTTSLHDVGVEIAIGDSVSGYNCVGGLVGRSNFTLEIKNCNVIGKVSSGIFGYSPGQYTCIGGLVGYSSYTNTISNCYAIGSVTGGSDVGGLVGYSETDTISTCYANSTVKAGGWYVGGLVGCHVGINGSNISNSYAIGSVSGGPVDVGGFVGQNFGGATITNCYSTCPVTSTGSGYVGGFVGWNNDGGGPVTNSYWDIETSGMTYSSAGTGKTTSEMKQQTTFVNWDFATSVWNIHPTLNNGYPYFEWQGLIPTNIFAGGDGSSGNPYQITNAAQLNEVRNYLSSSFIVINDIDLTDYLSPSGAGFNAGALWDPIGNPSPNYPFCGNFNGNNKKITGLKINRPTESYVGFFGVINGGSVYNLGVEIASGDSVSGSYTVGGLSGYIYHSSINNSYAVGMVTGNDIVGGLVGWIHWGNISHSFANCTVSGTANNIGGFAGYIRGGAQGFTSSISNSYARGSVSGIDYIGGFVGCAADNDTQTSISNCYSTGAVTGGGINKGGLVGYNVNCTATNSYWDTETSGIASSFGGVGKTTAEMKTQSTFVNWDFTTPIWNISSSANNGYPFIVTQSPTPLFAGGDGTLENPYQIVTPEQLNFVRNYLNSSFILMNNIDLTDYLAVTGPGYNAGAFWIPIGTENTPFQGNFNGNAKKISGLKINRPTEHHIGLFGCTYNGAVLQDLGVEIAPTGSVSGHEHVGSLVGENNSSAVIRCYANGTVATDSAYVGGLVGGNAYGGTITNSYANVTVSGGKFGDYVGGLAGYSSYSCTISNCYATGVVSSGDVFIGGLVGYNYGSTINDSYARCAVSGDHPVGGLAGGSGLFGGGGGITNSYSTGTVSGRIEVGGLVGRNGNYVNNSYWDIETSGLATSSGGEGKTTAEMKLQPTFVNWDFATPVWNINPTLNNGYPYFEWQELIPLNIFAGGDGSGSNPYQITNVAQLNEVRNYLSSAFIVMNDIDLTDYLSPSGAGYNAGAFWLPLGNLSSHFSGNFNGGGNKITGLKIYRPTENYVGLFGLIDGGSVYNLGVEIASGGSVRGYNYVGGLSGYIYNSIINNSYAIGMVTGNGIVGGLVGWIHWGNVSLSYANCSVSGFNNIGGFTGYIRGDVLGFSSSISNSYAIGSVSGKNHLGGFVGCAGDYESQTYISNCYSTCSVTNTESWCIGGLLGSNDQCTVTNSYWDIETSGKTYSAGGEGKTTAEMKQQTTFVNWDFATPVWNIHPTLNDGYPFLEMNNDLIALTAPNGGESLLQGLQYQIVWENNLADNVIKIELYQNDVFHSTIISETENGGLYLWNVPKDLSGLNFKIKISSVISPLIHNDISDGYFKICAGKILVVAPNGLEVLAHSEQYPITWLDNITEDVKIELYQNDAFLSTIIAGTPSDGSYLWNVPSNLSGDKFKIKISSKILPQIHYDLSDDYFTIENINISISFPQLGSVLEMLELSNIQWTDNLVEDVIISLYKNTTLMTSFVCPSSGSCEWNFYADNLEYGTDYKIKIESSIYSGIYGETGFFTIRGTNNVKGSISGIWTEVNSPYILTDSTYIGISNSLVIEPGVKIKKAQEFNLFNIQGQIEALGVYDKKINFFDIDLNFNNTLSTDSSKIIYSVFDKTISVNDNSKLVLQNCIIENINGYGVVINNAEPVIANNLISNNKIGIKLSNSSPQYINNNTIADNDSLGLYFGENSDAMLVNNIIYGNGFGQIYINDDDSDPDFFYNNLQGGKEGFILNSGVIYAGSYESNIAVNPLFITGTYNLHIDSPCLDFGYPDLNNEFLGYLYIPVYDLAGNPRLSGEIDMGCYEYIVSSPATDMVSNVTSDTFALGWVAVPDANSYLIYASDDPNGNFELIATVYTTNWSADINLNTKKFYYVVASTESEESKRNTEKIKIKKIEDMLKR